jgi:hypothetical protein
MNEWLRFLPLLSLGLIALIQGESLLCDALWWAWDGAARLERVGATLRRCAGQVDLNFGATQTLGQATESESESGSGSEFECEEEKEDAKSSCLQGYAI